MTRLHCTQLSGLSPHNTNFAWKSIAPSCLCAIWIQRVDCCTRLVIIQLQTTSSTPKFVKTSLREESSSHASHSHRQTAFVHLRCGWGNSQFELPSPSQSINRKVRYWTMWACSCLSLVLHMDRTLSRARAFDKITVLTHDHHVADDRPYCTVPNKEHRVGAYKWMFSVTYVLYS